MRSITAAGLRPRRFFDVVASAAQCLAWKAYFRLAQTPKVWRELDQWLRDRLRAIQLKVAPYPDCPWSGTDAGARGTNRAVTA
ncbi:MAG: hypothetical protein JF604_01090 [Bradyrhizobium sp.]|nr:hypothetical protein [Bradyrhizobium sp.]